MKKKLDCILLIDDDGPTNFLHEIVIKEADCAKKVVAVRGAQEALDFLSEQKSNGAPDVDLIFLDINMPRMTGWDFLEEYVKFNRNGQGRIIIMLTTSLNPYDEQRARKIESITDFVSKPLTVEMLHQIVENHF